MLSRVWKKSTCARVGHGATLALLQPAADPPNRTSFSFKPLRFIVFAASAASRICRFAFLLDPAGAAGKLLLHRDLRTNYALTGRAQIFY